ncbi:sulfotransferase [Lysobacter sp. S4-A87]|uniref:tetratricopeptide repeat-containing sulfotransferase family protein n=1 Tax=Lysobacter sp. S4-A87 TaxID=2925843 RepID=UPI001F53C645|nr:sulfotransferase [Lysobacter sp. S4-A87]UNK50790.1 sulfotransferase [Lysobacter sp. S4-A87]
MTLDPRQIDIIRHAAHRGEQALTQGDWQQALREFETVVALDPRHTAAQLRLAAIRLQLDHYRAARRHALLAVESASHHPAVVLELARTLTRFNEYERLLDLIGRSGFAESADGRMLAEMAQIVSSGPGDQSLALDLVDRSLRLEPQVPRSRYLRGVIEMFLGRPDEAEVEFEASIALQPQLAQAHWLLSLLRKWKPGEDHVVRLRALLAQLPAGSPAAAYAGFALHNELHDLKDFDPAWVALEDACRIKAHAEPYDDCRTEALFSRIKAICNAGFVAPVQREDAYVPVFIVGMHRSGTTLLERILGGHSQVADGGESYAFTAQLRIAADHGIRGALDEAALDALADADFDAIGRGFIDASRWRTHGKPFLTEKLPLNVLNTGFIARALPNARILHMVRDPVDTCFSNLRTYFSKAAPYSFDQRNLARYYGRYLDLMEHWRQVMPGRILDVSYDGLVNDTEATARQIFDFCGLPFEAAALRVERDSGAVATASMAHVRQGILGNRGAAWKPYRAHLQPLLDGLAEAGAIPAERAVQP